MGKVDSMQEEMDPVSREMEIPSKNKKGLLKMKNTMTRTNEECL